jgi:hypothetical protein
MIEKCYKQIAEELGADEYRILAGMLRIFYTSKEKLKELLKNKQIDKKVYENLLANFPVKNERPLGLKGPEAPRVFPNPIQGLPLEFSFYTSENMTMKWSSNKSTFVAIDSNNSSYLVRHDFSRPSNDNPNQQIYRYKNNKLENIETIWNSRKPTQGPYTTIEDDEKIIEKWDKYDTDEPAIITTFKKTGAQRKEWLVKIDSNSKFRFRKNGLPSIVEEDGTQIWTTVPGGFYEHVDGVMVAHDEVGDDKDQDEDGDYYSTHNSFGKVVHDTYYDKYTDPYIDMYINRRDKSKPTIIKADGTRIWYKDGYKHHVIYPNGESEWWDKGQKSKEQKLLKTKLKNDEVVDNIMKYL